MWTSVYSLLVVELCWSKGAADPKFPRLPYLSIADVFVHVILCLSLVGIRALLIKGAEANILMLPYIPQQTGWSCEPVSDSLLVTESCWLRVLKQFFQCCVLIMWMPNSIELVINSVLIQIEKSGHFLQAICRDAVPSSCITLGSLIEQEVCWSHCVALLWHKYL